ncbi:hypothetical protein B5V03_40620 [Bradyrhizobium betae]|uniref:Uncharacterized protein n=1 Tax=Bradyrhizobium betae TaxID=244734 RepID=A0A4Q1UFF0_9BRAD|nr:hypothetical protein B5V03_40620 [Bradyrhizobium betae]
MLSWCDFHLERDRGGAFVPCSIGVQNEIFQISLGSGARFDQHLGFGASWRRWFRWSFGRRNKLRQRSGRLDVEQWHRERYGWFART